MCAVERDLAILDTRYDASPVSRAFLERQVYDEVVALVRFQNLITTRARLRLLEDHQGLEHPSRSDRRGLALLPVVRLIWDAHGSGQTGPELIRNLGGVLHREVVDFDRVRRVLAVQIGDYETVEQAVGYLEQVVPKAAESFGHLPPVLSAISAVRAILLDDCLGDSGKTVACLLFPMWTRWRSRKEPLPLSLAAAFVAHPERLMPAHDHTMWLVRMLKAVRTHIQAMLARLRLMEEAHVAAAAALQGRRKDARHLELLGLVERHEVISLDRAAALMSRRAALTNRAVAKMMVELERLKLVREITGRKTYKAFAMPNVHDMDLRGDDEEPPAGLSVYSNRAREILPIPSVQAAPAPLSTSKHDAHLSLSMAELEAKTARVAALLERLGQSGPQPPTSSDLEKGNDCAFAD
jgi:hypothetical protein